MEAELFLFPPELESRESLLHDEGAEALGPFARLGHDGHDIRHMAVGNKALPPVEDIAVALQLGRSLNPGRVRSPRSLRDRDCGQPLSPGKGGQIFFLLGLISKVCDGYGPQVKNLHGHGHGGGNPAYFFQHDHTGQVAESRPPKFFGDEDAHVHLLGHFFIKLPGDLVGLFHMLHLRCNGSLSKLPNTFSKQFQLR